MHRRAPRPCLHPRLPTPAACQIPFVPILRHPPVFASAGLAAFFPPSSRGLAPLRGLKPLNPKTSESGRAPPGPPGPLRTSAAIATAAQSRRTPHGAASPCSHTTAPREHQPLRATKRHASTRSLRLRPSPAAQRDSLRRGRTGPRSLG